MSRIVVTWSDVAANCPEIRRYVKRIRPSRNPRCNPWLRYEKAKRDIAPLIPDIPGAYEAVIAEIAHRLRI
jgi:hypothetical protein